MYITLILAYPRSNYRKLILWAQDPRTNLIENVGRDKSNDSLTPQLLSITATPEDVAQKEKTKFHQFMHNEPLFL